MDRRELVAAAFRFERTDRMPRYDIFLPEYKREFCRHYGLPPDADPYDFYEKVDIGCILADQRGPFYRSQRTLRDDGDDYIEKDSWGRTLRLKRSAYFEQVLDVAIPDKAALDALAFDPADDPDKYARLPAATEAANRRFAPVGGVLGLFMGSYRMRGELDYLVDLAEDPEFCEALAGRLAAFITESGLRVTQATGTRDTAIWVYDELACTKGPLFSPGTFEKVFYPHYRRMIGAWNRAGIHNVVLHCDGNCEPFLDMLLDAGFRGVQGIAPSTGMWLPDIRKKYGRRLVLIGGMCNIHTLTKGSFSEIRRQAEEILEAAGDGGVIIGTHSIADDVPVDNYNHYYAVVDEYDRRRAAGFL